MRKRCVAMRLAVLGVLLLSSVLGACSTQPQRPATGAFVKRALTHDGATYRYQVFVPSQQAGGRHPPLILFLHGTGERGSDGAKPTQAGLGPYLRLHLVDFPAIVVFPQAPDASQWNGLAATIAFDAMEQASEEFGGDHDRTYLTGLSMGGYGVWELALMRPQRFAALVPICGALLAPSDERDLFVTPVAGETDPYAALARRLKDVPIWMFHGARDDLVLPHDDRLTYAALRAAGGDVRYTEFPDANHNAWDPAYATPELWQWLLDQHRR